MLTQAEFLADDSDVLVVTAVLGVLLDGLAVQAHSVQAADLDFVIGQSALAEMGDHQRLPALVEQPVLPHELIPVPDHRADLRHHGVVDPTVT